MPSTGMKLVDPGLLLESQDQAFTLRHFELTDSLDG
jgi:hypothetical protein